MKISSLMDVLVAACLTPYVKAQFSQQGGLFLIAPPGQFKTTMLRALENIEGVQLRSDMHTQELNRVRDDIAAKKIRTLVFLDFQKIFERRSETSANIVGNIRALVDEGYQALREGTPDGNELNARAVVIGAMTPHCERVHRSDWTQNGFSRRMLFCVYAMKNPEIITQAIVKQQAIAVASRSVYPPVNGVIPFCCSEQDSTMLLRMLRYQYGRETPLIFMQKIVSVLRWNAKRLHERDHAMETMKDFSQCLGKSGAELEIDV